MGPQSWQICPSIHIRNRKPEVYSHPQFAPQRIPMGNHRMEHCWPWINTTLPIVSKAVVVETHRQPTGIIIIQSVDANITTIGEETIVAPSMDVDRRGVLIGSVTKLGSGLSGISARRNLNKRSTLSTTTTRVVGTPQIVFTNLIMSTHVVQDPTKSFFSNKDLVWTYRICYGRQNKVNIHFPYVPYVRISKFLEGEIGIWAPSWNGMFTKTFQAKWISSHQLSKTTLTICGRHLWH